MQTRAQVSDQEQRLPRSLAQWRPAEDELRREFPRSSFQVMRNSDRSVAPQGTARQPDVKITEGLLVALLARAAVEEPDAVPGGMHQEVPLVHRSYAVASKVDVIGRKPSGQYAVRSQRQTKCCRAVPHERHRELGGEVIG